MIHNSPIIGKHGSQSDVSEDDQHISLCWKRPWPLESVCEAGLLNASDDDRALRLREFDGVRA